MFFYRRWCIVRIGFVAVCGTLLGEGVLQVWVMLLGECVLIGEGVLLIEVCR